MAGGGTLKSKRTISDGPNTVELPFSGQADNLNALVKYRFGPNPNEGFTLTAGGKIYFKGWSANEQSFADLGVLPYPKDIIIANVGLQYGFHDQKTRVGLVVDNALHAHTTTLTSSVYSYPGRQFLFSIDRSW
jgi:hypothetical protein